jgi:hypothetical protein
MTRDRIVKPPFDLWRQVEKAIIAGVAAIAVPSLRTEKFHARLRTANGSFHPSERAVRDAKLARLDVTGIPRLWSPSFTTRRWRNWQTRWIQVPVG